MDPEEKLKLANDLDIVIHTHHETTPGYQVKERTIIEPEGLKEVLRSIIAALPENEL